MRMRLSTAVLAVLMALPLALWAAPTHTFTGIVTDTKCGLTHPSGVTAAQCTNACVKMGAHYALAVGSHVYQLDGHAKQLHRLAGEEVVVRGKLENGQIHVQRVRAQR